jgi:carbonic anhydrase
MIAKIEFSGSPLAEHNKLSQANVLLQLEHLKSDSLVQQKIKSGHLNLHAWWFDIASGNVYSFNKTSRQFALIEE